MSENAARERDASPVAEGREILAPLGELLGASSPPFAEPVAARFRDAAMALERAFAHVDDVVVIALAGGTGVGKSTLINALAGAEITHVSARRPTSDRVVVYRHRDLAFASRLAPEHVPFEEHRHTSEDLRRVVILDLPDADSIRADHRRIVAHVLPQTDLVLLVTDPSKYGDRVFYELVAAAGQAQENKRIVFNKIDAIAAAYGPKADEVLADLIDDLRGKLAGSGGGAAPPIFAVSAREAFAAKRAGLPVPDPFRDLELFIHELREEKLRARIKRRNLDAAMAALKAGVRGELERSGAPEKIAALERAVADAAEELDRHGESIAAGIVTPSLGRQLARYLAGRVMGSWSMPAQLVARLFRLTQRRPGPEGGLVAEKLKAFRARRERAVAKLAKLLERQWGTAAEGVGGGTAPLVWDLRKEIDDVAAASPPRRFRGLLGACLLVALFFVARPAILEAVDAARTGKPFFASLADVLLTGAGSVLRFADPLVLLPSILLFCLLYAAAILLVVLRVLGDAEEKVAGIAGSLRRAVGEAVRADLERFRDASGRIRERVERLKALVG